MRSLLFSIIFYFISIPLFSQDIQSVLEKIETKSSNNPQEKMYLHLDKFSYSAGETMWFKSYTTIGIQNMFSGISGIAYIELVSPTKKIVNSLTIPLIMGIGIGDIALSDTITEGSYRLRAYTNWMKNGGEKYFYDRTIHISNGRSDNITTSTSLTTTADQNIYAIDIKSLSGVAMTKAKVSYEIEVGDKIVEKKKITADENGQIKVPVDKKHTNAFIKLSLENIDKSAVHKIIPAYAVSSQNHIDFLPEGGKLIMGRINAVGIKSINSKGLGAKAKIIFLAKGDTIGETETNKLGMGGLSLFLNDTASIQAKATFDDGTSREFILPKIYEKGISIAVNNLNDNRTYAQINLNEELIDNSEVYFIAHHLGRVLFVSKQKLNKDEIVFSLDKKGLPNGVITLSVLNSKFLPIVERPIFNYSSQNVLHANVSTDKSSYAVREKVKVDLEVGNATDSMRIGAFSASVIDLSKVKDESKTAPNILSSLLLSADLSGFIESPAYYFDSVDMRKQDLDYLMMTQGWRNIDWNSIATNDKPTFEAEKTLKISGYTKKFGRGKAEPNAKVQLISTKNFMDFIDTVANAEGYFEFNNLLFPDSVKFLITAKDAEKGKNNIDIVYDKKVPFEIGDSKNNAESLWDINSLFTNELKALKQYFSELEQKGLKEKPIAIEEVVVNARQTPKAAHNSSNLNGVGRADQIISAEDLSTCNSLEMCLAGRIMGVTWQQGVPYNTRGNVPMQVVLDGMYIESDQISMINITDIESIEVLRNVNYTAIYGQNGANGLLVITSKTGLSAMRSNIIPKGIVTIQPQGIYVNKLFYKPAYDVTDGLKFTNDVRPTIHWESSIVTDKDGKASFDFFTSDGKGKYLMIIEGIDLGGRLLRKETTIQVN